MTFKVFQDGNRLPASDLNEFIGKQLVVQIADDSELSSLETYGVRVAITLDTGQMYVYNETGGWRPTESGNLLTIEEADERYLAILTAQGLYLTQEAAQATYLTSVTAQGIYLTQTAAGNTYLTQSDAANLYLTPTDANNTYLTLIGAGQIYLRQDTASSTYQTQPASGTFITDIQAGSIYISKTDDVGTYITTIDGGKITTGTISADRIGAGTFVGSTFKTADGTAKRVLVSSSSHAIKWYNTGDGDLNERGSIEGTSNGLIIAGRGTAQMTMGDSVIDATSGSAGNLGRMLLTQNAAGLYTSDYGSLSAGSGTTEVIGPSGSGVSSIVLLSAQARFRGTVSSGEPGYLFQGTTTTFRVEDLSGSTASTVSTFASGTLYRGTGSDERLKENVVEMEGALDLVNNARPVSFNYKDGTGFGTGTHYGLIAQELQSLLPEENTVISTTKIEAEDDDTDYLTIEYQRLIPIALGAIKELSAKNDALEARIAALEAGA